MPEAEYISRPRFSHLAYEGAQNINRLPPRSAVVAFSAADVYETAELLRRRRGGTAVVLGALSPRTRNAQVGMFEAGEVDHLVATDAIGMGLNLRLAHVAFAALRKFDGRIPRPLGATEIAQIAGRAGRHMSDGTFGTTLGVGEIAPEIVEAVVSHRFETLQSLRWRSRDLSFRHPRALLRSLEEPPPWPELERPREADDQCTLAAMLENADAMDKATSPAAVRLLWEVCQIPDFRKILSDDHVRLLSRVFHHLMDNDSRLPTDWLAGQLAYLARSDGDIDQLSARLAQIRTWTYVTYRSHWLDDPGHWQGRARAIEDKLSDALHQRLTHRFVDRRATVLVQRLRGGVPLAAAVRANGEVLVEGQLIGRLEGFRLGLDESVDKQMARPLLAAARKALSQEIPRRLKRLEEEEDEAFALAGRDLLWRGQRLARLRAGDWVLAPRVEPLGSEFLSGPDRERLRRRLSAWLERHLRQHLEPLFSLEEAALVGLSRGLAFQLVEALGLLPRRRVARQLDALSKSDRRALAKSGVTIGAESLYLPALGPPPERALCALLWSLKSGVASVELPGPGTRLWHLASGRLDGLAIALGLHPFKTANGAHLAVEAEALERFGRAAASLARQGPFQATSRLARHLGCSAEDLDPVLVALGYEARDEEGRRLYRPKRRPRGRGKAKAGKSRRAGKSAGDSPFAVLGQLKRGGRR